MTNTGATVSEGVLPCSHDQLSESLRRCESGGKVPMIWGAPGIGKTDVVHKYGMTRAEEEKREFKVWHRLSGGEKMELFKNPEARKKTYLVYDNRAASNDTTDDKGIPNISNGEFLEWLPNMAYLIFAMEESMGLLFNDELTLAPTLVQNSMYKMVHDHAVGDIAFNPNIFVVCAGNRVQDQAFVQETPLPLRTRMIHFWLVPAKDKDQIDYFMKIGVDHRLIAFFSSNPDKIFYKPEGSDEFTACTPRCIENCSHVIKGLDYQRDRKLLELMVCGSLSTLVGKLFMNFMKHTRSIDLDKYLKKPSLVANLRGDLDSIYGLITLVIHRFSSNHKSEYDIFDPSIEIFDELRECGEEETGILMLRMMKDAHLDRFKKGLKGNAKAVKALQKIAPIVLQSID